MVSKNTICLWYDGTAVDAARFYAETFPDSAVGTIHRAPGDYPAGQQGRLLPIAYLEKPSWPNVGRRQHAIALTASCRQRSSCRSSWRHTLRRLRKRSHSQAIPVAVRESQFQCSQ